MTPTLVGRVQFHLYPKDGTKFMTDEQALAAGEKNMRHRCAAYLGVHLCNRHCIPFSSRM